MSNIEVISWILRGSQRRVIFRVINGTMIPAQIYNKAKEINSKITRNNVSDILRELKEKELIVCLNPNESKGRLYQLTDLGKEIQKELLSQ